MNEFLGALWFFLPAGIANASPVFANRIPGVNRFAAPLDFGKTYRGQPIFGTNKRWRGLFSGMLMATLVVALQKYLFNHSAWIMDISWFDYSGLGIWLLGPLFGAGALLGDAVESFFKRQAGIAPGHSWFPFDQTDYIIGGCLFSLPIAVLSPGRYALILIIWLGMHMLASYIGYLIGLKEKPI